MPLELGTARRLSSTCSKSVFMVPKFRVVMGVKVSWGKRAEILVAILSLREVILVLLGAWR